MQDILPNKDKEMTKKSNISIVLFRQYAAFINIHIANIYLQYVIFALINVFSLFLIYIICKDNCQMKIKK